VGLGGAGVGGGGGRWGGGCGGVAGALGGGGRARVGGLLVGAHPPHPPRRTPSRPRSGPYMNLGFIVPRYGLEVHGGAEHAARLLAEHVAARPGWSAEVFTTCAQDAATWEDAYAPGTVSINGVAVHRFRSRSGRGADFAAAGTAA